MKILSKDEYSKYEKVGEGASGEVFKAEDKKGEKVAIKVFKKKSFFSKFFKNAKKEYVVAKELNSPIAHPNILSMKGIFLNKGKKTCLCMEYVQGRPITDQDKKNLLTRIQLLEALIHAHSRGFYFWDHHNQNILITENGVKLIDFGAFKKLKKSKISVNKYLKNFVESDLSATKKTKLDPSSNVQVKKILLKEKNKLLLEGLQSASKVQNLLRIVYENMQLKN